MAKTNSMSREVKLDRPITLIGAIALVVGGVVGMGIYALIAGIGAEAGSTLWLAFALAMVISVVGVAPLIQIASALPRAGAGYLYTSRLLNPLMGTIVSYWAILGVACSTCFVSLGLAGYIAPYLPWDIPVKILALILPCLFFLLYLFRLRLATWFQILLVVQLIVALLVYAGVGSFQYDMQFSLSLPQAAGGLIMAVVLCYSACMGFQVIGEMGEEMVNARRNIPLAIAIGGAIILIVYILVGTVFISSVPYDYETIKGMTAPLVDSGRAFLSPFWLVFLSIGALSAGLTSFNAAAIAMPREFFAQARDGIAPLFMGKINERTRSPINAVGVYVLFAILLLLLGRSIDFYAVMTAVGILGLTAMMAIAAFRLPSKLPDRYSSAYFKMSKPWLFTIAVIAVVSSLGFVFLVLTELPVVGLVYLGWTVLIVVYYFLRVRWLKRKGFDWEGTIKRIPGLDEE